MGLARLIERLQREAQGPAHTVIDVKCVCTTPEPANNDLIIIPCSKCAKLSPPFIRVINGDLWKCEMCLPSD